MLCLRCSLLAGPRRFDATVHPSLKLGPSRAFRCPPTCRRVRRRPTSSGFRTPTTVSPGLAPCEAVCHLRFGSALRLSQPLSGFLANPSSAALFRAATVPGTLPSERSPRRDRLPLSGQLGFPAVIHRRAETHASTPYRPWFHRRPRERVRLDSPTTMGSLSPSRSPSPGHPGCRATGPLRPASFTYFEASLPLRVRSLPRRVSPPGQVAALLGFFPSRVFSKQASESVPARVQRLEHARLPASSGTLTTGSEPPRLGEASPLPRKSGSTCSTDSSPLRDWPAPPLRRRSSSHDLGKGDRSRHAWPTESLSHLLSGVSSAEAPTLLRFPASSSTSCLWVLAGPGLSFRRPLELASPLTLLTFGP